MNDDYREHTRTALRDMLRFAATPFDAETMVKALEDTTEDLRRMAGLQQELRRLHRAIEDASLRAKERLEAQNKAAARG